MKNLQRVFSLVLFFVFSGSIYAQEIPDSILRSLINPFENYNVGIGMAKAESEWESISLAMTRARVQIARTLSSEVRNKFSDYTVKTDLSDDYTAFQEDIIEVISTALLKSTRIVVLIRTSDGAWWCTVYMPKNPATIAPQQIDFSDTFLYDLSRVTSISSPRVVSDINLWINHVLQRMPEDMVYGFGVARLGTDTASFQLAKERAINSIAHSLHVEISSTANYLSFSSEIDPDYITEQFNESILVKSEYENSDLPLGLVDFVKTEDGSLWVALGCKVISETFELQRSAAARLTVPAFSTFDAEARMEEAFRKAVQEGSLGEW